MRHLWPFFPAGVSLYLEPACDHMDQICLIKQIYSRRRRIGTGGGFLNYIGKISEEKNRKNKEKNAEKDYFPICQAVIINCCDFSSTAKYFYKKHNFIKVNPNNIGKPYLLFHVPRGRS